MSKKSKNDKLLGIAAGTIAAATIAGGVLLSPTPETTVDAQTGAVDLLIDTQPNVEEVLPAEDAVMTLSDPMPTQSICYVIKHQDAKRIGEIISINSAGYQWAPFEYGVVEINGVKLGVAELPDLEIDPVRVSCGELGYNPETKEISDRPTRCAPISEPEALEDF